MSDGAFGEEQTLLHRSARFALPHFAVRLLSGDPPRGKGVQLPVDDPAALTKESVDALSGVVRAGVWRFLAREVGWRKRPIVTASGRVEEQRLWIAAEQALAFSPEAIRFLIQLYNATRDGGRIAEGDGAFWGDAPGGDVLLHHLVYRRLRGAPALAGILPNHSWDAWGENPLNVAYDPRLPIRELWFSRLIEPDLRVLMRWLSEDWVGHWTRQRELAWDLSASQHALWNQSIADALVALADQFCCAGREDFLQPFVGFASDIASRAGRERNRYDAAVSGKRHAERPAVSRPWAALLKALDELGDVRDGIFEEHPIERTPHAKRFMAVCEESDLRKVLDSLSGLRQHIAPTLS